MSQRRPDGCPAPRCASSLVMHHYPRVVSSVAPPVGRKSGQTLAKSRCATFASLWPLFRPLVRAYARAMDEHEPKADPVLVEVCRVLLALGEAALAASGGDGAAVDELETAEIIP